MRIPIYQVDAFTDQLFSGNPAAICPLDKWLDDELLQKIAAENNLSETAFFVKDIVGPKGAVSMVPNEKARVDVDDLSDSAAIDKNTKQNLKPNSAISGGIILGRISRRMIQPRPSPRKRAAST